MKIVDSKRKFDRWFQIAKSVDHDEWRVWESQDPTFDGDLVPDSESAKDFSTFEEAEEYRDELIRARKQQVARS